MPEVKSLWPGYAGAGAGPGGGEGGLAGPGGRWLWPPGRRRCGRRSICPPELGRRRAHVVLVQVEAPARERRSELPVQQRLSRRPAPAQGPLIKGFHQVRASLLTLILLLHLTPPSPHPTPPRPFLLLRVL